MKKRKWIALLALPAVLFACSDDSYKGTVQKDKDDDPTPVPVLISLNRTAAVETKGVGAIDTLGGKKNPFVGSKVFIYSFKRQTVDDGNNYFVTADMLTESGNLKDPDCLINDGGIAHGGIGYGKEAIVNADYSGRIDWSSAPTTVFFPSSKIAYDFFGYYLDDLSPLDGSINRTQDAISFKVEIDGSQDLMSAKAFFTDPESTDEKYHKDYIDYWRDLSDAEKQNVKEYAFSSYTARRNIQPILHFKHHLVRLNFEIYGGAPDSTVEITKLSIEECPYKADFTVAAKDESRMGLVFDETAVQSYLLRDSIAIDENWDTKDHNLPDGLEPFKISKGEGNSKDPYSYKVGRLGAGLLLPKPLMSLGDKYGYNCVIEMRQIESLDPDTNEPNYKTFSTTTLLRVKDENSQVKEFEVGNEYTVRIAVYGLKTVDITVKPEGWKSGGEIDVNEDDI